MRLPSGGVLHAVETWESKLRRICKHEVQARRMHARRLTCSAHVQVHALTQNVGSVCHFRACNIDDALDWKALVGTARSDFKVPAPAEHALGGAVHSQTEGLEPQVSRQRAGVEHAAPYVWHQHIAPTSGLVMRHLSNTGYNTPLRPRLMQHSGC